MLKKIQKPIYGLAAILILSFLLRIIHVRYGLPMILGGDEALTGVYPALNILVEKSIRIPPDSYHIYPGLTAYLYLPFVVIWTLFMWLKLGSLESVQELVILNNAADLMAVGRVLAALSAVVTLYFVYKIAKSYLGHRWALLATSVASLNLIFLVETSFGKARAFSTMFITIAIFLFLKTLKEDNIKKGMLIFGLFGGLAYAAHQSELLLFAVLFVLALWKFRTASLWSLLPFLGLFGLFSYLYPYTFFHNLDLFSVFSDVSREIEGISLLERFTFYFETLLKYFPFQILFIVLALFFRKWKDKTFQTLLLICLGYYLLIGPIMGSITTRYLMPITPLLAILAVTGFKAIFERSTKKPLFVFTVLFLVLTGWNAFFWTTAMLKPGTLELSRNWLIETLQKDEWAVVEKVNLAMIPSKESLELIKSTSPDFYLRREQLMEERYEKDYKPEGKYNVVNLFMFPEIPEDITSTLNGYLVLVNRELMNKTPVQEFFSNPNREVPEPITDNTMKEEIPFLYLPSLLRSGPNVRIYSLESLDKNEMTF